MQGQGDIYIYPVKNSLFTKFTFANDIKNLLKYLHILLHFSIYVGFISLLLQRNHKEDNLNIYLLFAVFFYLTIIYAIFVPWPRYAIPYRPLFYTIAVWSIHSTYILLKSYLSPKYLCHGAADRENFSQMCFIIVGYTGGIIASIAIVELAVLLSGAMGWYWGLSVAVFIVVIPVMCVQRVPGIDFVPAYFIGSGVFFGIMTHCALTPTFANYGTIALHELLPAALGLGWGFVTVTFQTWYTEKMTGGEAAGAEAEKKAEEVKA